MNTANKFALVTTGLAIGKQYQKELQDFFQGSLDVDLFVHKRDDLSVLKQYDLVLLSHYGLVSNVKAYLHPDSKVLCIKKNLSTAGLSALEEVSYGTTAYVVNVGPKTCQDSINLIYSHGRTDLILYPYYPGEKADREVDLVITQGEGSIPHRPDLPVVDIFDTVLDTQIYWEIILFFHLSQKTFFQKLAETNRIKTSVNQGFSYIISEKMLQDNIINTLFENLNEGVLIYDDRKRIINSSTSVRNFIGLSEEEVLGKSVYDVLPISREQIDEGVERLLGVHGTPLICEFIPYINLGTQEVGLIILKRYDDIRSKMNRHTKELISKGHLAKYSLNDIGGSSQVMMQVKSQCLKMASTEATILILGESGTGKEIFAHIIHENSLRSGQPFVAINCAAFSENLLESELFGYDEGAFTGAKRGGKQGIFEQANGGTLFLDEVGELPLHLQNRLLRVLQEKEVVRVGGDRVIPVDVRVVAATNVNLLEMVANKTFRKDLYYRLCVLPLKLPPLREREGDCLEIFQIYCNNENCNMVLSPEVQSFFLHYPWDGNVRELKNCFEYLKYLGKTMVTLDDLPKTMFSQPTQITTPISMPFLSDQDSLKKKLLTLLWQENQQGRCAGRQRLTSLLREQGGMVGEQTVRALLLELQEEGLVSVGKGRAGSRVTPMGQASLKQHS